MNELQGNESLIKSDLKTSLWNQIKENKIYDNENQLSNEISLFNQMNIDGETQKKSGLICVVCGAPANGYNFDAITCESCKAFFRRNAFRPLVSILKIFEF
jgi:hypothetical protein